MKIRKSLNVRVKVDETFENQGFMLIVSHSVFYYYGERCWIYSKKGLQMWSQVVWDVIGLGFCIATVGEGD